jgi:hypothetical protein
MNDSIRYIFLLCALLIAGAYFIGVSTDAATLISGLTGLVNALTGRDATGKFAAYPVKAA